MRTRYPFDPTGQSATNLVRDEIHTLDTITDVKLPRYVFPKLGAFYNNSLVVKQGNKKLVLNQDYYLSFFWQDATAESGHPVSVAFQIINKKITGNITITYQVVGGKYQDRYSGLEALMQILPLDAGNVFWDEVLDKPEAYIPTRHLHHINDVFGLSRIIGVIDELRRSLEGQSVLKLKTVYDRFLKLKQYVEANLIDYTEQRDEVLKQINYIQTRLDQTLTPDSVKELITREVTTRTRTLNTNLTNLTTRVQNVENKNRTQDNEIANIKTALTNLETALSKSIDNKISALKSELTTSVSNLQNTLNQKITAVESSLNTYKTANDKVVAAAKTTADTALTSANKAISDLTAVRNALNISIDGKIDNLKAELNEIIAGNKTEATRNYNTLTSEVNKLKTTTANQTKIITAIEGDLETSTTNLTNLINSKHSEAIGKATSVETNLTARINTINTSVTSLTDKSRLAERSVSELNNKITALESSVNTFKDDYASAIGPIETTLKRFETLIIELESEVGRISSNSVSGLSNEFTELARRLTIVEGIADRNRDVILLLEEGLNDVSNNLETFMNWQENKNKEIENNFRNGLNTLSNSLDQFIRDTDNEIERLERDIIQARLDVTGLNSEVSLFRKTLSDGMAKMESTVSKVYMDFTSGMSDIKYLRQDITTELLAEVDLKVEEAIYNLRDDLSNKISGNKRDIDRLSTETTKKIDDLISRANTLESEIINKPDVDEESIKRIVSNKLHEIIVEKREEYNDHSIDVPSLIVYPDEEGGILYFEGEEQRVYPVTHMSNTATNNELQRYVFAPGTVYEFEKSTTWTIPDFYDGLVAQVYVTTAVRGKSLSSGKLLVYPSMTRVGYIKLKGGTNVPITVGTISSFGTYLTNDGTNRKGLLAYQPPYVTEENTLTTLTENIKNYFGKGGKVMVIV